MTFETKVLLIDVAVFIPSFGLAAYGGANLSQSLIIGFMAATLVNVIGIAMIGCRRR